MTDRPLLEIAANSLASARAAQDGGADRIELCAGLEVGGLTPSPGLLALVCGQLSIPVHVLIRPRGGDFAYSDDEHHTMLADIAHCRAAGCAGIVTGALDPGGSVDVARCRELVEAAGDLHVTFHRAIDVARDPEQALEDIIALGCRRVLSSGGAASAPLGADLLRRLLQRAAGRITVMPGAGITAANIARLRRDTGATDFHASAKRALPSAMHFHAQPGLDMDAGEARSDAGEVSALIAALRADAS